MADERDAALLRDIVAACREVRVYLGRLGYEDFAADGRTFRAVERCLEIIGEAARQLTPAGQQAYPQVPWRRIIGLRNRLSREYGDVDHEEIFLIATISVPALLAALEERPGAPP